MSAPGSYQLPGQVDSVEESIVRVEGQQENGPYRQILVGQDSQ